MANNVAPKWNSLNGSIKLYFSRHPIVCAYIIMGAAVSVDWFRRYFNIDPVLDCVQKYRRYNIVVRPDEPTAKYVKRHEIGLDRA